MKRLQNLKIPLGHNIVPSLLHRNKFLALALEKYAKTNIKIFRSCPTLLDFVVFLKTFCR